MRNKNVYRKMDNGRYMSFGVCYEPDYLPDGIWYVRHLEHSRSTTSLQWLEGLYKVGEPKHVDLTEIAGLEDILDKILDSDGFHEIINRKEGVCYADLVRFVLAFLNDEKKKKEDGKEL